MEDLGVDDADDIQDWSELDSPRKSDSDLRPTNLQAKPVAQPLAAKPVAQPLVAAEAGSDSEWDSTVISDHKRGILKKAIKVGGCRCLPYV
jgi:hypothetical protein